MPISRSAALVHDEDLVHVLDGRKPMGDGERRPPGHQDVERLANQQFRFRVDARRRLVQDQDSRIERQRAGKRQQLLLSDRQRCAALTEAVRVAAGQVPDEPIGVDSARRLSTAVSEIAALPSRIFAATVPEKRWTSWSTRLKRPRSSPRSMSLTSRPSIRIRPPDTS